MPDIRNAWYLHTKNPGVFQPNDYEKRAGGARRERVRITSPFTVGVAGLTLSTASKGRIGCWTSYTSAPEEQNADRCPMTSREVWE